MHKALVLAVCYAGIVLAIEDVSTEDENIVKKGTFPYMAILYYPDDSVVDAEGLRIIKAGVLIRENWLISSNQENTDTSVGFPKKTLLAKLGAINIDTNFTLNEDDNEQEREIIQIARPTNFNATTWWYSDISFLKTLVPFKITLSVAPVSTISHKSIFFETNCYILLYTRPGNNTEDRVLVKSMVYILPGTSDKCGSEFKNESMLCAAPSDEKSNVFNDPNFCEYNRGGPLICEDELTGIQTYVQNCNQPYLYQKLSSWENLLSCAIEEKCLEEQCGSICFLINKDPLVTSTLITTSVTDEESDTFTTEQSNQSEVTTRVSPTLTTEEITTLMETKISTTFAAETNPVTESSDRPSMTSKIYMDNAIEDISHETTENVKPEPSHLTEESGRRANVLAQHHRLRSDATMKKNDLMSIFTSICLLIV